MCNVADTGGKFLGGIDGFIAESLHMYAEGRKRILGDFSCFLYSTTLQSA